MSYALTPALGEIRTITGDWGVERIVPYADGGTLYVVTFDGTTGAIPESPDALVQLAMIVVEGARKAGYLWNVQAILISPGDAWRVDVVLDASTPQFIRFTGWDTMRESIAAELAAKRVSPALSLLDILSLTGADAKQFSPAGGIAPFVVCSEKGCSPTKAASSPHPKQMMRGTVENVAAAVPLTLGQVLSSGGIPWWFWPTLAGVAVGAWLLSTRGSYTPNESCPYCPGGKVPR